MPDCAIFADTQGEPRAVYEHLNWLCTPRLLPFPIHVVTAGNLWKSATRVRRNRAGTASYIETAIPVFLSDGLQLGMGKRHCTRDFKINPVTRKIRDLLGLRSVRRNAGHLVQLWMGISADEADRMKPHPAPWITTRWPLIERDFDRDDCLEWMSRLGYPRPPRSACTFCPFRDDDSWLALSPPEFADVAVKEKELQAAYSEASAMRGTPHLHDSRRPISEVQFHASPPGRKPRQLNMFRNECAGLCGT
jgi:hypothetical protein